MKKLLIGGVVLIGVLLAACVCLVLAVIVATQGTILTGGVPLGGVTFTSGDIPGVPVYPGAVQSTDSAGVSLPDDMRRVIGTREAVWKRYLTGDSPAQVLAWYDQAIAKAGYQKGQSRQSGVVIFFPSGDVRGALYVTTVQGKTNIILATGKE
jgi:hypothetical protein